MTKLSRTQRHRTDRRVGWVGAGILGVLVLPYALPVGIVAWLLGSVVAMAAMAVVVLAVVAMVPITASVAIVGAVTLPITILFLLTIGSLATAMILTAQRAWDWSLSARSWIEASLARRAERVVEAHAAASSVRASESAWTDRCVAGRRAAPSPVRANRLGATLAVGRAAPATGG